MSQERKVALITGGNRGIGRVLADALAEAGMHVALSARDAGKLEAVRAEVEAKYGAKIGIKCIARPTDVARPDEVAAFVEEARAAFGRIDVLVNCAGIYGAIGELSECDVDVWRSAIEVNLLGTMYATRAVIPVMRAQGAGAIVNFAGGGIGGPNVAPRVSAYATSKAAVVQFTECIAKEVSEHGITINTIAPGAVVTEMTAEIMKAGEARAGKMLFERTRKERETGTDRADEAKALVLWLATANEGRLTGKLISATRDDYKSLDAKATNASSVFTFRRVDNVLYREVR